MHALIHSLPVLPRALAKVFSFWQERAVFLLLTPALFLLFVTLLVRATPGNDFAFQLQLFQVRDYLLLGILAALAALLLTMQLHDVRHQRSVQGIVGAVGRGSVGGLPAVLATILGTASCSACVAAIFGFLGIGSVLFVLQYRWWFVAACIALMLVAILLTARKIEKVCAACGISTS